MNDDFNIDSDDEGSGNEWLATYGDLVTLLLCFFVLLFAMSTIDNRKFLAAMTSFSSMNVIGLPPGISSSTGDSAVGLSLGPYIDNIGNSHLEAEMDKMYAEVRQLLTAEGLSTDISLERLEEGVLLVLKDDMLFDKGNDALKPEVKNTLSKFGSIFREYNKKIRVEGHTDNVPIKNSRFASNWELSAARAISVVRYFSHELPPDERIHPSKFEVAGLAEYAPVAPNDTNENRQKNRRIEIIVLK